MVALPGGYFTVLWMGTRGGPNDFREDKELCTLPESAPNGAAEAVCNEV